MDSDSGQLADLAGEVFEFADLIDYQTGSIVSRTLVNEEAATMTVFALDEGQTISEHSAPHEATLQVLDGTGRVRIEDETYDLEAGEAIVFPANTPHAVEAPSRFKMLLTMVR
ncbi:cupin domain-containing protein [Halopiger goleimassiliensis]|uniref:cupin domain-containing protein n=1 Tax=Halopiger goleimassiliensis TaxID=1293048 RepID=UPI00067769DE|nr:cupin domain-containing protein [Halopiger goleimassiliensis]